MLVGLITLPERISFVKLKPMPFVGVVAAALTFGVMSATPSQAASDFYTPPSSLPSANGALIKTESMKLAVPVLISGSKITLPGKGTRIMYKSTDEMGQPVAVTGTYIEPTVKWTGKGDRPLVSLSAGTQGQGDACAPSKTLGNLVNFEEGDMGIGYEIPSIYQFLAKGVAVVVTDYVGLGTTDRVHTYTNRLDMAHAVLDAARAAKKVSGTSVTSKSAIGLYGYSQGGGASGAAVELAPSYAPDLNIKGAFVGAPPANLYEVMKSADGTMLTGVIGYAINGIFGYRPALKPQLEALMNTKGKELLEAAKTTCIPGLILKSAFAKTSQWTNSGKVASEEVKNYPQLLAAVDAQRIGRLRPTVPVMVLSGTQDDIVDHKQVRQLAKDWCGKLSNVTYKPVIQLLPTGGTSLNHILPMVTEMGSTNAWLVDRLNGKSVVSNCIALPLMP